MAKRNRGKSLKKLPGKGRGECPLCHRTGIKLLFVQKLEGNKTLTVCKYCQHKSH